MKAKGILDDVNQANFRFEDALGRFTDIVVPSYTLDALPKSITSKNVPSRTPREARDKGQDDWFDLREEGRTLYAYVGSLVDAPKHDGSRMRVFLRRLKRFVARNEFDRFVLDLRSNGGGSANFATPLVTLMAESPKINRRGRLFTLTSVQTYSAAALLCGMLENRTRTLFVGEPTGEGVNLFGDAPTYRLPNSGLVVRISERWWQGGVVTDDRRWIAPDIAVPATAADSMAVIAIEPSVSDATDIDEREASRMVGHYRFTPWQELVVSESTPGALSFRIHDRIDGPQWLAEVASDLRLEGDHFETDMAGVVMLRTPDSDSPADRLVFDWRGERLECERLQGELRFAGDLVDGENIAANWNGLRFPKGPDDKPSDIQLDEVEAALRQLLRDREFYLQRNILEQRPNIAGYRFLRSKNEQLALRVFQTNVELYPRSANTHDSLGEAYLALGDEQQARVCYERALELNPQNSAIKKVLQNW